MVQLNGISPVWTLLCWESSDKVQNDLLQSWQECGLMSSCLFMWSRRARDVLRRLLHCVHSYGLASEWTLPWLFNNFIERNCLKHVAHLCSFCPPCCLTCMSRSFGRSKTFPHTEHGYCLTVDFTVSFETQFRQSISVLAFPRNCSPKWWHCWSPELVAWYSAYSKHSE